MNAHRNTRSECTYNIDNVLIVSTQKSWLVSSKRYSHLSYQSSNICYLFARSKDMNSYKNAILFLWILSINSSPFRWSSSCWKTTAPNPSTIYSHSFPYIDKKVTLIFLGLITYPFIPGTERQPSQKPSSSRVKAYILGLIRIVLGKGCNFPYLWLY